MKLHSLEITGIGPFRDPQQIDFEALGAQGLFLIDGPTGAGKTTIIDAIVFALYGTVSGSESDGGRMRSLLVDAGEPSLVACEFSVGGRRPRIERSPKYLRAPRRGSGKPVLQAEQRRLVEYGAEGEPIVELTAADEVGIHVNDLLGMNADQFRKLVVLPQGEFAALLRMSPTDRLKALEPLLGDAFYKQVQARLQLLGQEADQARSAASSATTKASVALHGALGGQRSHDGYPDDSVLLDDSATGDARLAAADASLGWLDTAVQVAGTEAAAHRPSAAQAREHAEALHAAASSLSALHDAELMLDEAGLGIDQADRGMSAGELDARIGELQAQAGGLLVHAQWEAEASTRERDRQRAELALKTARGRLDALAAEQSGLPDQLLAAEVDFDAANALAALAGARAAETARLETLVRDLQALSALRQELVVAQEAQADADRRVIEASARHDAARADELAAQAQVLAATLVHGEECPVCGSVEHPNPSLGDGAIEANAQALARCERDLVAARAAASSALSTVSSLLGREREALQHVSADADAASIAAELDAARALEGEASSAHSNLAELDAARIALRDRRATIGLEHAEQLAEVRAADASLAAGAMQEQARRELIVASIGSAESATARHAQVVGQCASLEAYRSALDALTLARAAVPESVRTKSVVELGDELASADARSLDLQERQRLLDEAETTLSDARSRVAPLRDALTRAIDQGAAVMARTATAIALGQLASGANARNLPLRAYAMQLRFGSVLDAASLHLLRMSQGKYEFEPMEEISRGHAGLGVAIRDHWAGSVRDPKSLSGGETFYASLALALGLAEVVQAEAGGSELETLFVDEGFGSLDQHTLELVLDQLDRLRSGGRVVGVVSHVTEMREAIPDRVEVVAQADRTSTTRMVV